MLKQDAIVQKQNTQMLIISGIVIIMKMILSPIETISRYTEGYKLYI